MVDLKDKKHPYNLFLLKLAQYNLELDFIPHSNSMFMN